MTDADAYITVTITKKFPVHGKDVFAQLPSMNAAKESYAPMVEMAHKSGAEVSIMGPHADEPPTPVVAPKTRKPRTPRTVTPNGDALVTRLDHAAE